MPSFSLEMPVEVVWMSSGNSRSWTSSMMRSPIGVVSCLCVRRVGGSRRRRHEVLGAGGADAGLGAAVDRLRADVVGQLCSCGVGIVVAVVVVVVAVAGVRIGGGLHDPAVDAGD